MKLNCTLRYKIKETHPDIGCVDDWSKDKVYSISDTYTFMDGYGKDECIEYAKHDLMLVVGGGYTTKDIEVVGFEY